MSYPKPRHSTLATYLMNQLHLGIFFFYPHIGWENNPLHTLLLSPLITFAISIIKFNQVPIGDRIMHINCPLSIPPREIIDRSIIHEDCTFDEISNELMVHVIH
jgi:hypothetical protein